MRGFFVAGFQLPEAINEIIREMAITGTVMAGLSQAAVKKEEG